MVQIYTSNAKKSKKRQDINKTFNVEIATLNQHGEGVAKLEGKVVFVKGALPTEKVKIKIIDSKKRVASAQLISISNKSEERREPFCAHYQACGGCQLQHLTHAGQLLYKQDVVAGLLKKHGWLDKQTSLPWQATIKSKESAYRTRVRLAAYYDNKSRSVSIGYRQASNKKIVQITQCDIMLPQLSCLIEPLRVLVNRFTNKQAIGHIDLNAFHCEPEKQDGKPIVNFRFLKPFSQQDLALLSTFQLQHNVIITQQIAQNIAVDLNNQAVTLEYYLLGKSISFSSSDFTQINKDINQAMVAQAIDWLDLNKNDEVLDLYCGLGNFSLPIADKVKRVAGIEGVLDMVDKAQHNANLNQLTHCHFYHGNLEEGVSIDDTKFNKLLLDPARAGAENICKTIQANNFDLILYVSCNPSSLARDGRLLIEKGYTVAKIGLLDMFPNTSHIETMVLFKKNTK
ncbi:23S rRNA (uracil(1939)-C(5))-methyltransferase RlmD [Saccharobesus litoralis]|uniref:23S rRNA (Uracil(1939)-C(5))-methyltransferase RlmD n=1 Tax=Saccharobesus litoralis TaxID=2172099 RepID=A0A2S0VTR6_9ALTE|nr:23S rRNA (uracil(1939)-C(5))-methyltransferase RlmD [Saccharobesus litoralis]AWB67583.1 23S rRNA (uracil(1939)-C(5))-methyltransferase RlmD [Saccharobesus litoralis]